MICILNLCYNYFEMKSQKWFWYTIKQKHKIVQILKFFIYWWRLNIRVKDEIYDKLNYDILLKLNI